MKKAFSFVEVLISVTIASLVMAVLFALANQNISAAQVTRDKFSAANLAQEGIEIVVNIRSNNWIACPQSNSSNVDSQGRIIAWRGSLTAGCVAFNVHSLNAGVYVAQYNSTALTVFDGINNDQLYINAGKYCHCPGNPTSLFKRRITIADVPGNDHAMIVISRVEWTFHNKLYSVEVEDRLYNWR